MSDLMEALYNTCEGDEESIMYQAADLIEQLQARVDLLERNLKRAIAAFRMYEMDVDCYPTLQHKEMMDALNSSLDEKPETNQTNHDAEVARKAFIAGATDAAACISQQLNLGNSTVDIDAGKAANEYAERVKRGEV